MINILNLKFVILLDYETTKTSLEKALFQIDLKKFFLLQKLLQKLLLLQNLSVDTV